MRLAIKGFRDLTLCGILWLVATCLCGCRGDGGSHVRVHYPRVEGAPNLGPSEKEPHTYEVVLELGPMGQVEMKTCRTPCSLRGGKE